MKYQLALCLLWSSAVLTAQDTTPLYMTYETAAKRTQKQYDDALELRESGEHAKALDKMEDIHRSEPGFIDVPIKLAEWYYAANRVPEAIDAFEKVIALDSFYMPRILYSLGRMYLSTGEYENAVLFLERFIEKGSPDQKLRENTESYLGKAKFARELASDPVPFEPEPIPGAINTPDEESLPAFTVDGEYMFFTRKVSGQEDLYLSFWDSTANAWAAPEYLKAVNTSLNEGAHAVSADGSMIAFTACNRRDGAGSCDLYFWRRVQGVWQRPMNAGGINSPAWDGHPALSPDGRGLYFSSERPGGSGGKDIWYTERHGELWTKPVNLGGEINTPGNEESPFLFFDGRTLYFMSDGHPGLGDSDLFVTTRNGNTWTPPSNLGYPINTHHKEGAFAIHPNREYAYFTSDKLSGQNDLYRFKLDSTLLPPPISNLQGVIIDAVSKSPLVADLVIYDLSDSMEVFQYTTSADGVFSSVLVHGQRYGLHAVADGYLFWSGQIAMDSSEAYQRKTVVITMMPLASESDIRNIRPVVLKNIEFAFGSASLLPSSLPELRRLLLLLQKNPEMHIEIRGHTDHVGSDDENLTLSEGRAHAVKDWLTQNGIASTRLNARGFGETRPVANNDDEAGRQENRRVEFVITRS